MGIASYPGACRDELIELILRMNAEIVVATRHRQRMSSESSLINQCQASLRKPRSTIFSHRRVRREIVVLDDERAGDKAKEDQHWKLGSPESVVMTARLLEQASFSNRPIHRMLIDTSKCRCTCLYKIRGCSSHSAAPLSAPSACLLFMPIRCPAACLTPNNVLTSSRPSSQHFCVLTDSIRSYSLRFLFTPLSVPRPASLW
jgi:hypothetical protein